MADNLLTGSVGADKLLLASSGTDALSLTSSGPLPVVFFDGMDHAVTSGSVQSNPGKWTSGGTQIQWESASGINGGGAMNAYNGYNTAWKDLGSSNNYRAFVIGMWFYATGTWVTGHEHRGPILMNDGVGRQFTLRLYESTLRLIRGDYDGTTLATGTTPLFGGQWYHLELYVYIDNTDGAYELRINGETEFSGSGVDTQAQTGNTAYTLYIGHPGYQADYYMDDVWVKASALPATTPANEFLGLCEIDTFYPDANGTNRDFTPSTGTDDFAVIDERPASLTDYLASSTYQHKFTVGAQNISGGNTIHAVGVTTQNDVDQDTKDFKHVCRSGTTDYTDQGTFTVTTTASFNQSIWEEDPDAAAAWDDTAINAAEWGVENQ